MSTLPSSVLPDVSVLTARPQPGKAYRLDLQSKRIVGMVDGLEAVTQAVMKILYTERYAWLIYNWQYGAEIERYLGQEFDFVLADIGREIEESLRVDDRVIRIEDILLTKSAVDALDVEFTVVSTEGSETVRLEVPA